MRGLGEPKSTATSAGPRLRHRSAASCSSERSGCRGRDDGSGALVPLEIDRGAPAAHHGHPQLPRRARRLGEQPRLAHAALARQAYEGAGPVGRLGQVRVELGHQVRASHERAGVEVSPRLHLGGVGEPLGAEQGEAVDHVERVAGAHAAVLRQQRPGEGVELRRHPGRELRRRHHVGREVRADDVLRAADEGRPAGQRLVEKAAQGVQIRARVELLAPDLLGSEVRDGAQAGRPVVEAPATLLVGD